MLNTDYHDEWISFRYPDDWDLSRDERDGEQLISLQSPDTAFWTITLLFDRPSIDQAVSAVVQVYEEEYEDVERHDAGTDLAEQPTKAVDLQFICVDWTNSAFVRAFRTGRFTAVVVYQVTDLEMDEYESTLESICESLECRSSDDVIV